MRLLLTDEDIDGSAGEIPAFPYLVLQKTLIRLLDVLRQVAVEDEGRDARVAYLGTILYLDVLALDGWRGI